MNHEEAHAMQGLTPPLSAASPIAHLGRSVFALLAAVASTACLDLNEADVAEERAIASELGGITEIYRCVYPLCGGASIMFDSRDLALRHCSKDARANALACEADVADSPAMPSAFWSATSAQLSCVDGLVFSCVETRGLTSCVCTPAAAKIKYGPVITIKPKG
jgi:hypothetical protein